MMLLAVLGISKEWSNNLTNPSHLKHDIETHGPTEVAGSKPFIDTLG